MGQYLVALFPTRQYGTSRNIKKMGMSDGVNCPNYEVYGISVK